MVEIEIEYQGELHCEATHGPSKAQLTTDAPVDNHGRGASFSPTDLVATALGTCMMTVMGIVAERHGWELTGSTVRAVKIMTDTGPRRIEAINVTISSPTELDRAAQQTLEKTALECPVRLSLLPAIQVPVDFHWGC